MARVAVAQISVVDNVKKNLQRILKFIDRASGRDADIVCFPETCLNPDDENVIDVSGEIKEIREKCCKESIYCIFSTYIRERNKIFNTVFLIDRFGRVVYKYKKVHLWKSEFKNVSPGRVNRVIDTDFGRIGIINCWDFAFPEFVKNLSKKGANIIFCPSYLVDYEKDEELLKKIPLVRAFENMSYYISCDAFSDKTLSESCICHPLRTLKTIKKREGIVFEDLNLKEIDSLRKYYELV
ncbi:MAG: N-carbamoyl-D-amino acid hydrolase [Candidatus Scalindua rubra]|uniref:N-carbamoyl-D-amino acid hydrolase n=1 Tax=Candidatus Scalindua rubra TaxID=1872076 RepID=A0A1E3XBK6_9BACT|nr:MAG: N-carbamoyl-D-amino acid hydrolase [Candidatus Scalindua rubra]